jgi:hypothetical protein
MLYCNLFTDGAALLETKPPKLFFSGVTAGERAVRCTPR